MPAASAIRIFLSHDWGKDNANHQRVKKLVPRLKQRGLNVWFDDSHMKGDIDEAMCKGIDECPVFIAFLTPAYMAKVNSSDPNDNVRKEFHYAKNRGKSMLGVRFSPDMPTKTCEWAGPLGARLGGQLYVDLAYDPISDTEIAKLVTNVYSTAAPKLHDAPDKFRMYKQPMRVVCCTGGTRGTDHAKPCLKNLDMLADVAVQVKEAHKKTKPVGRAATPKPRAASPKPRAASPKTRAASPKTRAASPRPNGDGMGLLKRCQRVEDQVGHQYDRDTNLMSMVGKFARSLELSQRADKPAYAYIEEAEKHLKIVQ